MGASLMQCAVAWGPARDRRAAPEGMRSAVGGSGRAATRPEAEVRALAPRLGLDFEPGQHGARAASTHVSNERC